MLFLDIFLKIILSSTILYVINFVCKTFTSNNFDKLFIPKHQKALHNFCLFIILFIIFIIYGVIFAALYDNVRESEFASIISLSVTILYALGLIVTIYLCLRKWVKEKMSGEQFNLSEKEATILLYIVILLNIVLYSIAFCEIINTEANNKQEFLGSIFKCIFVFFSITYLLLESHIYLLGLKKRKWSYVLSPVPANVEQKYLEVLYSLTPTQLVLAEKVDDSQSPSSVYLYDITKNTYIYFERVVKFKK